jgi:predicted nucleotidyltransferase
MQKSSVVRKLIRLKPNLSLLGVNKLGVFGSTVRGEQTKDSDIDILIDFQADKETYQNYLSACDLLEAAFKRSKLDIVTYNGLSPYIGEQILSEVEYV